jgi:hypothetical protein
MLLFKKPFWAGLTDGSIRLTFRRWQRPHVRPGGRYRCHPIGVLEVEAIERVPVSAISEPDARLSGHGDRAALLAYLAELGPLTEETLVYRVALRHGGDGDRVEIALDAAPSAEEVAAIAARLARMDAAAPAPWTRQTLALIAARPRVAASQLARAVGRETAPFKVDVRKLKRLGLTQSFEVGYEVSPRGRAFLAAEAPRASAPRRRRAAPRSVAKAAPAARAAPAPRSIAKTTPTARAAPAPRSVAKAARARRPARASRGAAAQPAPGTRRPQARPAQGKRRTAARS